MLQFDGVSLRRGPRLLFEQAGFQVHPGQKIGITGANGSGKSSLFALVLGELHADTGDCRYPADWVIAHVAQETPANGRAAIEYVLDGDAELREVQSALSEAERQDDGLAPILMTCLDEDPYELQNRVEDPAVSERRRAWLAELASWDDDVRQKKKNTQR